MRRLAWLGAFAALLCLCAAGAGAWLLGTQAGLRWAAARAESLSEGRLIIAGASGALASSVSIERLTYDAPGLRLEAQALTASVDLLAVLGGRLAIEAPRAASIEIELTEAPAGGAPSQGRLPFALEVENAFVQRLEIARAGTREVLSDVRIGHATLDGEALSLAGSFFRTHERLPAQLTVALDGTLDRFELVAGVQAADTTGELRALIAPSSERKLRRVEARVGPVDLSRLDPALPSTAISAQLTGEPTARHALAGTLSATNAAPGPLDKGRLPVARMQTSFASADLASVALEQLHIALGGGGELRGSASVNGKSFRAELQASAVDLRALRSDLRQTRLQGPMRVRVSGEEQFLSGRLSQEDLSVEADVRRVGEVLDIRRLRASARGGELTGEGQVRLGEPPTFEAQLALAGFDPAAFGDYPAGSLNGTVVAAGKLGASRSLDVTWTARDSTLLGERLESRGRARLSGHRLARVDARASLGASRIAVKGDFGEPGDHLAWELDVPELGDLSPQFAGRLRASGTLEGTWAHPELAASAKAHELRLPREVTLDSASASVRGTLGAHRVELSASSAGLDLDARLQGGWRSAEGWSGEIRELTNAGEYPLRLLAPAALAIAREGVKLGRLEAALGEGRLLVREFSWADERMSSSGEFTGLPAQWLVLGAGLAERLSATLRLDGEWALAAAPNLEGKLSLRRASGDVRTEGADPLDLGLRDASLEARLEDGRLSATASLDSRLGSVAFEGEVAPAAQAGPLGFGPQSAVSFRAGIDFAALRVLAEPLLGQAQLDGRLRAELRGEGTLGEPIVHGTLRGEAIEFQLPPYGVYLSDGELRATLEGDALKVEELSIRGGRGRLTASGTVPLRLADGSTKLAWRAENFTLLERPDMRLIASGKGQAGFDGKRFFLTGALRADRGYFEFERERLPKLGEDVVIVGEAQAPARERPALPVALDLSVDLGDELAIFGQGLEGKLAGRLQVQTTKDGELRAYGRLHTVNATFLAYGQRLQVDPGVLIFDGPIENPSLQITAWRRNQAVEAGVQVTGTARAPRVELVSQPPVPEGERLSWLVLGRAPGEATQADLGLLQAAAGALLSRGNTVPLDRRIARAVGLDELGLRGSGELEERVVALGKRLSDRLYVSYEQGLGAVAAKLVKLDFSLSQRWSVRAETGSSSGLGLFYRFSWD